MPSLKLPIAFTFGATLMAWRAYETAPEYSGVQIEMMEWVAIGSLLVAVCFFWELFSWYLRMDRRFLPKR
jgi:hypothetical protein